MSIENIPEIYFKDKKKNPDLFVYYFKMTSDVVKSKVNLGMNMFSFLQIAYFITTLFQNKLNKFEVFLCFTIFKFQV